MKLKTNFAFSGKLLLDGDAVSVSGKFQVNGAFTKTISRAKIGKDDLQLDLALDFTGTDKLTGTVAQGSDWTANLVADRKVWSTNNPATNYTNQFTMLVPGFADPSAGPPGDGFAALSVNTNGLARIGTGNLADSSKISQSVAISQNGDWPLYAPLYKSLRVYTNLLKTTDLNFPVLATNKSYYVGSLLGWLTFTNDAPTGKVSQIKGMWTNAFYPAGFTNTSTVVASRYDIPAPSLRALDLANGTVTLTNGNLITALLRNFTLATDHKFTVTPTNQLVKLKLAPKTGLLTGEFRQHRCAR